MVAQFFLSQEVAGKDTALARLNAQISRLTELLSLEQTGKNEPRGPRSRNCAPRSPPPKASATGYAAPPQGAQSEQPTPARPKVGKLSSQIDLREGGDRARAMAQVDILNQQIAALRRQLAAIEDALVGIGGARQDEPEAKIADLGSRLNVALAQKVQELSRYRSDFFGRLREILGDRQGIRVVGDRFVFNSEVLFDTGQAGLQRPGQIRARSDRRRRHQPRPGNCRGKSAGCCRSTATRMPHPIGRAAPSSPTGTSQRRAPSPSCNI